MSARTLLLWSCIFIFCIADSAIAASIKNTPLIRVETETREGELPLVFKTLTEGSKLLQGDFNIKAMVQLPFEDQRYVDERLPLELGVVRESGGIILSMPPSTEYSRVLGAKLIAGNHVSKPNLLDEDELWLTYRPTSGSRQCELSVDIAALGLPYSSAEPATPLTLKLFNRSVDVALNGDRVLPRDVHYLIKRSTGMGNDPAWRVVDEGNRQVFMHLLRVDLHNIDSIDLEMSRAVKYVNFRLSRKGGGKPTDVLLWEAIPKYSEVSRGKQLVHLNLAKALRQQMPGVLEASSPIELVEAIAFVPKDAEPIPAGEAPINYLKANYAEPVPEGESGAINLPTQIERVSPNTWRWRVNLGALQGKKFHEIEFLNGRIEPRKEGCVAAFERAEFVRFAERKTPVILADIQSSARTLGGPFGMAREGSDEIESPQLLADLSLSKLSGGREGILTLSPGGRQAWDDLGLSVTSLGTSSLTVSLNAGGLRMQGDGDIKLSWDNAVPLPSYAYLSVHPVVFHDARREVRLRLRFSDGRTETLPYSLGDAVSLQKFAGRRLVGTDLLLQHSEKSAAVFIDEMALFTVRIAKAEQALKESPIADHLLDAYRVKLESLEIAPRSFSKEFWHELAKGEAELDYGDMRWGGGVVNPVLKHLIPAMGEVKEWKFIYKGDSDARLQAWFFEPQSIGAVANPIERWFKLGLIALMATWGVILWRRRGRLLSGVLALWSNCIHQLQRLIKIGKTLAEILWNFWKMHRQTSNLLSVSALWAVGFYYLGQVPANPLWGELPYTLTILTLFSGLNMWRWRLQAKTTKPNEFLKCWIVGQGVWPPRVIWVVVVMTLAFMLVGVVSQFGQVTGIQNPGQFLSGMGMAGIALFATIVMTETQSLVGWVPVMLAVFTGLAPWLGAWIYRMVKSSFQIRGILIVFGLYALGVMQIGRTGENYFLTLGNMAMVMAWYIWIGRMKECMQIRWPSLAEKVYGGVGAVYFSGALVGLVMTVMLLLLHLEWLAEQFTVIAYFCLVVGTVLEIVALRRAKQASDALQQQPELAA